MSGILHKKIKDMDSSKHEHKTFAYTRHEFVPRGYASQCLVSVYEIPPGKSAYPYHYHVKNEEVFYIISGNGMLKTPNDEKKVTSGEMLFFPADRSGAHKLTNTSETENLVYIDFSTHNDLDVCLYPDSNKVAIWGKGVNRLYRQDDNVDYYESE